MKAEKGKGVFVIAGKSANSVMSMTSQEMFESAMEDIFKLNHASNGFCRGEPLTDRGKLKQMVKMLVLLFIPVLSLWCLALQSLSEDVGERSETEETLSFVRETIEIGQLAHRLQRERDLSVFFYTALGPSTKSFLLQEYAKTDKELEDLSAWPVDLDRTRRKEFVSKEAFQIYLASHRLRLGAEEQDYNRELNFYSSVIDVFILWIYDSLKLSKYGTLWKSLVAYVKVINARESVGFERSLGSIFFVNGRFANPRDYHSFLDKYYTSKFFFQSAKNYSPIVVAITNYGVEFEDKNLSSTIAQARREIIYHGIDGIEPSLSKGQLWYDTMSLYLDILLSQQKGLADRIIELLENHRSTKLEKVVASSMLLVIVVFLSPLVFMAIQNLTSDIQRFAITLVDKTKELSREKRKTDSLIYQMVPKPVADVLKKSGEVEAEYFKEVTVFFSDIVGFTQISAEVSPMEIVTLLNNLYNFMDSVLDRYDAYKVETINDTYMIASGLPKRNGSRHASEIADLSLDLIYLLNERHTVFLPSKRISLRIGINTGPVVAGIVGSKMPRYCLFGDTVNTASRLQTNGMPNRIHISATTRKWLRKKGGYITHCRGSIHLKGKGNLVTHWLVGKGEEPRSEKESFADEDLPGEITYGSKDASKITIIPPENTAREQADASLEEMEGSCGERNIVQPREGFHY